MKRIHTEVGKLGRFVAVENAENPAFFVDAVQHSAHNGTSSILFADNEFVTPAR